MTEGEVKLTIPNEPLLSVRQMTRWLFAAGWTRRQPRPKEPWYWRDPLGLNDYSMRLEEAYGTQRKRERNGIAVRPNVTPSQSERQPK
jgi:hypothetical protein